jgi:hypothetical protein
LILEREAAQRIGNCCSLAPFLERSAMSNGSPKLERRQKAIESTRRRLRRLEIEAHRIRAELARLEADYEDDVADWLSRKLRRRSSSTFESRVDAPDREISSVAGVFDPGRSAIERRARTKVLHENFGDGHDHDRNDKPSPLPQIAINADNASSPSGSPQKLSRRTYRKTAPPLVCSLAVHAAGLLLCLSFGVATIVQQSVPLFASPTEIAADAEAELSEVEIEPTKFEDPELQNVVAETEEFNLADSMRSEFEPTQLGAGSQPIGDVGQLDALPSELGTLMAGAGAPGSGPPGGDVGNAVFFGARSQGDRFVFVVDNSSSMKDGRLEAAISELVRSVGAMSPRQSFYVIFVSDRIYPMFYPQAAPDLLPATAPNKKRLAEWLPRAATASGKNRELIKAVDMAARLRPHAVFFLWDGRMDHAGVRQDVMTHMTRPHQWSFPIHTIGMGVDSLDSEYNLATIAQASGGTFRRVDVPAGRGR